MLSIINWLNSWTNDGKFSIFIFLSFALILFFVASKLIHHSEIIIKKTRFGGAFVGGVLIAATTSVPEFITDLSQSSVGHPGAGNASDLGSNAFSMFLIAIAGILLFKKSYVHKFDKYTRSTMVLLSLLSLILGVLLYLNKDITIGIPGRFAFGIIPLAFFITYFGILFYQYKWGTTDENDLSKNDNHKDTIKKSTIMFFILAMTLIGLALVVNWSASSMIHGFGLNENGVGGILLAIITSLPEVITFFLLLKRNQPIAGAATLIGSGFFNLAIMFVGDLAFVDGPTFAEFSVHKNYVIAFVTAIGIGIIALQSYLSKKGYKSPWLHMLLPLLAAISYIAGWIIELTIL